MHSMLIIVATEDINLEKTALSVDFYSECEELLKVCYLACADFCWCLTRVW